MQRESSQHTQILCHVTHPVHLACLACGLVCLCLCVVTAFRGTVFPTTNMLRRLMVTSDCTLTPSDGLTLCRVLPHCTHMRHIDVMGAQSVGCCVCVRACVCMCVCVCVCVALSSGWSPSDYHPWSILVVSNGSRCDCDLLLCVRVPCVMAVQQTTTWAQKLSRRLSMHSLTPACAI